MPAELTDMSVAPEIARLAETILLLPAQPATHLPDSLDSPDSPDSPDAPAAAQPPTLGTLAGRLRLIAGAPQRWWGLVRFEPDRPVTVDVEGDAAYRAWLVVLPPGHPGQDCDCDVATVIAGEVTEGSEATEDGTGSGAILRPGPLRVHGRVQGQARNQHHRLRGQGPGYSITLHARGAPVAQRR